MTKKKETQNQWRATLRRQSIANVKHWLVQIESSAQPAVLIANEYENLLRALESVLGESESLSLAYELIQKLHATVLDFADWDRWLVYLQKVLKGSEEAQDLLKCANLSVQIGEVAYCMGLHDEAETSLLFGAEKYRELGQQADYAKTLTKLGVLYDLRGNMVEGIRLCEKALKIAQEIEDDSVLAGAYLDISHIYYRARNLEASITAVEKAYDYFRKLQRAKDAIKALLTIIAISAEIGDWEQVEALSQDLMDKLILSENVRTLSQLKNNLGVVAFGQSKFNRAETFWQEALTLNSQIGEPVELAGLYNNLGMVYTKLNEWEAAEVMLQQAVTAYEELGDIYNWANALDNIADLYEVQGKTAAFQDSIHKAIDGLQSIKDIPHAKELLYNMQNRL